MSLDITTPFDVANGTDYETASGVIDSTEWDTLDLNITLNMDQNYGQYFMYLPAGVDFQPLNLRVRFQPGDGTLYIRWDIQTSVWGGFTTILSTTASYTLATDVDIQITRNSSGVIATYVDGTLADSFTESSTITVGPGIVGINNTATSDLTVQSLSINVAAANIFAATLDDATLVAAGNIENTGTLAVTLADSVASAAGALEITGALAETLADSTLNAAGSLEFTGSLSQTLDDITQSATGLLSFIGTLAATLDDIALAATGTSISAGADGTLTATLDSVGLAAQGVIDPIGLLGITLDATALNAVGAQQVSGTFTDLLSNTSLAAVGGTSSADEGLCMRIIHDREYNSFSESFSQRDNESIIYQINFTRLMKDRGSSISSVTWSSSGASITNPSLASNITQATLRSTSRHNVIKVVATQADGVSRIKTIDLRTIDSESTGNYN